MLKLSSAKFSLDGGVKEIFLKTITNYWLAGGIFLHIFALMLWVMALKKTDLSYAYPFITLGFVIVALFSWMFLKEDINAVKLAGLLIISLGVIVVSYS
jgi:drug/metabolite transporter (DMT)-like permease